MRDPELLRSAVEEAAALASRMFAGGFRTWAKTHRGDPVTEADYAVDALLKERLLGARPDYGWLSEETADSPARLEKSRLWVVDPIDGTRDFARGRTGWGVSVALVEDGQPVLAALVAPERELHYFAEAGAGARLNGAALSVPQCARLEGARVPGDPDLAMAGGVRIARVEKPNAIALRLAMLAAGDADAMFNPYAVRELDIAAAALIATEAGAVVSDLGGRPLGFNKPVPKFEGLAAACPSVHAELLAALGAEAQARGQGGISVGL